jgi:hypothetical protein
VVDAVDHKGLGKRERVDLIVIVGPLHDHGPGMGLRRPINGADLCDPEIHQDSPDDTPMITSLFSK